MRFSIIVPIYNKECYVRECLESIRNQSFKDFECLMIDDGSTDSSSIICKEFSADDERFKYYYKENGGLVSARKYGAQHATGEYVINVDADDFIKNDFLKVINEEIERNSPDTVCFKFRVFHNEVSYPFDTEQCIGYFEGNRLEQIKKKYLFDDTKAYINSGSILFNICTKCIERELYIRCQNMVDNSIRSGEDTTFTLVWCFHTESMSCIDYDGYMYRQEDSSIEHTFNSKNFDNLLVVCNEMKKINNLHGGAYQKSIEAYGFYRLLRYVLLLSINSKTYFSFIKQLDFVSERVGDLFNYRIDYSRFNAPNRLKSILLIKKRWALIYLMAKTWFKNRL